jgi:hypothetical protein
LKSGLIRRVEELPKESSVQLQKYRMDVELKVKNSKANIRLEIGLLEDRWRLRVVDY